MRRHPPPLKKGEDVCTFEKGKDVCTFEKGEDVVCAALGGQRGESAFEALTQ